MSSALAPARSGRGPGRPRKIGGPDPPGPKRTAAAVRRKAVDDESPSKRKTRNPDPAKPDMPANRRTTAQVALDEATKAQELRELQHVRDVAVAAVAALEAAQDAARLQEQRDAVLSISDLEEGAMAVNAPSPDSDGPLEDPKDSDTEFFIIDDADFERIEKDEAYLSYDPDEKPAPRKMTAKVKAPSKMKKFAKGELKTAIEVQVKKAKDAAKNGEPSEVVIARPKKKGVQNRQVLTTFAKHA
ncbi:hypothetical protein B0H11DRAFT_1915882 [Mycena galericulata]|nr:hypothetical protein B0H11DRAFT_1915882 [Mycena galericulata]